MNKKSKFSILSVISSYFDSERSFASYHTSEKKTRVGFMGKDNLLVIVSTSVVMLVCRDSLRWSSLVPVIRFSAKN